MDITEAPWSFDHSSASSDRWLERGSKFFKAASCKPVVRRTLLARGLTDEELARGWQLYSSLRGFGRQSQALPTTRQTAAP